MLRVVFAEDNYLVREGTVALLSEVDDVEVVGTAAAYDELMAAVEARSPDAVLTDIRMPPTGTDEGIRAAKAIRAEHPDVGVVVLSQFADEEYAYELLKDGAAGLGYYAYDLGAWRVYSLNSEVVSQGQIDWLRGDLAANPRSCIAAYWHHPRYSSGEHGNNKQVQPWWDVAVKHGVDVILNGHDHNYERFGLRRGIREFVVGTGGVATRPFGTIKGKSQKRLTGNANWGVLDLELTTSSYTWQFRAATGGTGTVRDSGSKRCHT